MCDKTEGVYLKKYPNVSPLPYWDCLLYVHSDGPSPSQPEWNFPLGPLEKHSWVTLPVHFKQTILQQETKYWQVHVRTENEEASVLAVADGWVFLQCVTECGDLLGHGLHHPGPVIYISLTWAVEGVEGTGVVQSKHLQQKQSVSLCRNN